MTQSYAIYWEDLSEEAQARMMPVYHENIEMSPIAFVDIEEEEETDDSQ